MKIFMAGNPIEPFIEYKVPYLLQSYYDMQGMKEEKIKAALSTPKMFLLDSGAFTFIHGAEKIDFDAYLDGYINFIKKYNAKYFFELDVDTVIGVQETERLREKLEKKTGRKSIPVFHKCRGMKKYREMCEKYDYIAIAATAITEETKWTKNTSMLQSLVRIAHEYGSKVHGLGYTRLSNINDTKVPFDSVDSTSAISGGRYAYVYKFTGTRLIKTRIAGRVNDYKQLNSHNIQEWIKMCNFKDGSKVV